MALDFGSARTGVAVSDPTGSSRGRCASSSARERSPGSPSSRGSCADEDPEQVVVGLPLTLRGERGEQARATERFADSLRGVVDVPVVLFDERFTTDLAQQTPSASSEDARAAAHLLSSYLVWSSDGPG